MEVSLFPPGSANCKSISQGCSCPPIHSFLVLPLLCQGSLTSGITYLNFNDLAVKGLLRKTYQSFPSSCSNRSFAFSGPGAERIL